MNGRWCRRRLAWPWAHLASCSRIFGHGVRSRLGHGVRAGTRPASKVRNIVTHCTGRIRWTQRAPSAAKEGERDTPAASGVICPETPGAKSALGFVDALGVNHVVRCRIVDPRAKFRRRSPASGSADLDQVPRPGDTDCELVSRRPRGQFDAGVIRGTRAETSALSYDRMPGSIFRPLRLRNAFFEPDVNRPRDVGFHQASRCHLSPSETRASITASARLRRHRDAARAPVADGRQRCVPWLFRAPARFLAGEGVSAGPRRRRRWLVDRSTPVKRHRRWRFDNSAVETG
jgi:hypothetical protein